MQNVVKRIKSIMKDFQRNVHKKNFKKLYYDRSLVSEVIDVNKTIAPKEYIICHYFYFSDKRFRSQTAVCHGFHDAVVIFTDLNSISILNILVIVILLMGIAKVKL